MQKNVDNSDTRMNILIIVNSNKMQGQDAPLIPYGSLLKTYVKFFFIRKKKLY